MGVIDLSVKSYSVEALFLITYKNKTIENLLPRTELNVSLEIILVSPIILYIMSLIKISVVFDVGT